MSERKRPLPDHRVIAIMRGPIGHRAVTEGWHGMLYGFIAREHRLPDEHEAADLKVKAAGVEAALRGNLAGALALAGASVLAKRERIAALVAAE